MKKIIFFTLAAVALLLSPEVFAQQGIGTNQPDRSSALDIVSTKRGLLIPRMAIPDLQQPDPVTDPAHALLVFNTGEGVSTAPGFYWWNNTNAEWKAVTGEAGDPGDPTNITVTGVNPINVSNLGDNNFEVSLELGNNGQLLVTELDEDTDVLMAVWKNPEDIFEQETIGVNAENGLTLIDDTIRLGGVLTETTTIDFNGEDFIFDGISALADLESDYQVIVMDENGALHFVNPSIFGGEGVQSEDLDLEGPLTFVLGDGTGAVLVPTTIGIQASNNEGYVLTTVDDGAGGLAVEWANPADIEVTDLGADNGLHIENQEVHLGGSLIYETTITTSEDNTLSITGLQEATADNSIIVSEAGVLRTVTRSLATSVSSTTSVDAIAEYSVYIQEINIDVDISGLSSGDINLNLPDASAAQGQVINIKLVGEDEADHYLSIRENDTEISYGALPHQSWIFKSNGTNWRLVGN